MDRQLRTINMLLVLVVLLTACSGIDGAGSEMKETSSGTADTAVGTGGSADESAVGAGGSADESGTKQETAAEEKETEAAEAVEEKTAEAKTTGEKTEEEKATGEKTTGEKTEDGKTAGEKEAEEKAAEAGGEKSEKNAEDELPDKRRAIMVNGVLYFDTGYNSAVGRCGVLDGTISGTVPSAEYPGENGQVNFEGAEGWQTGFEEGTVDVYVDNRFRIFASEGTFAKEEIPAGVGCMMGTVASIRGDGYFVFRPTSIPEAFSHLAREGEYLVPLSAMENDPAFPLKEGEVNWSLVTDGMVMVYCDAGTVGTKPPVPENDNHDSKPPVSENEDHGSKPPVPENENHDSKPPVSENEDHGSKPPVLENENHGSKPLFLENVYHVFRVGSSPMLHAGNPTQRKLDEMLEGLVWTEETCDGLPEYIYYAEDGTAYQINLSDGWIWREGKEEAPVTEVQSLILEYRETYGLNEAGY